MRPLSAAIVLFSCAFGCGAAPPTTPACKAVVTGAVNETLSCTVWIVVGADGAKLSFGGLGAGSVVKLNGGMTFPADLEPKDYPSPTGGSAVTRGQMPTWEWANTPDTTVGTATLHLGTVGEKVMAGNVSGRVHATGEIKLSMIIDPAYGSGSTVDVDLTFTDTSVVPGAGFESVSTGGGAGGGSGAGTGGGTGGGNGGGGGGSTGGGTGGGSATGGGSGAGGGAATCHIHLSGARTGDSDCSVIGSYSASDDRTSLTIGQPTATATTVTQQLLVQGHLAARAYSTGAEVVKTECAALDPTTFASWNEVYYGDGHSAPAGTLTETITSPGTVDGVGTVSDVHGSITGTLPALSGTPSSGTVEVTITF